MPHRKAMVRYAIGRDSALTFTISPSNATNKNVTWSSTAPNVASVANGMVTAVSVGNATIMVTTADGGKTATCVVNVVAQGVSVTCVTLTQTTLSLMVGDTRTLTATLSPANAANKAVAWTTSDASIAYVSAAGVVTAISAGTANITVTTADEARPQPAR
jgi:uncharacterized protein YjdB